MISGLIEKRAQKKPEYAVVMAFFREKRPERLGYWRCCSPLEKHFASFTRLEIYLGQIEGTFYYFVRTDLVRNGLWTDQSM